MEKKSEEDHWVKIDEELGWLYILIDYDGLTVRVSNLLNK